MIKEISKEDLQLMVAKIVSKQIELNKDLFEDNADKNKQSLLVQLSVLCTIETLNELKNM